MIIYNGDGFIAGVPARDLTEDEAKECGGEKLLISTGLYSQAVAPKKADKKEDGK